MQCLITLSNTSYTLPIKEDLLPIDKEYPVRMYIDNKKVASWYKIFFNGRWRRDSRSRCGQCRS